MVENTKNSDILHFPLGCPGKSLMPHHRSCHTTWVKTPVRPSRDSLFRTEAGNVLR